MTREALGVDGRRREDELQVRPFRDQLLQVTQKEIDVEAALVRLVEDDRAVLAQLAVALGLREQDAVGHQLDHRPGLQGIVEAHFVAHQRSEPRTELLRDARRDRARGDAPRLRVADPAGSASPHLEQDLGKLRGFSRPGLAADDDYRMSLDCGADFLAPGGDQKRWIKTQARNGVRYRPAWCRR